MSARKKERMLASWPTKNGGKNSRGTQQGPGEIAQPDLRQVRCVLILDHEAQLLLVQRSRMITRDNVP